MPAKPVSSRRARFLALFSVAMAVVEVAFASFLWLQVHPFGARSAVATGKVIGFAIDRRLVRERLLPVVRFTTPDGSKHDARGGDTVVVHIEDVDRGLYLPVVYDPATPDDARILGAVGFDFYLMLLNAAVWAVFAWANRHHLRHRPASTNE